MFIAHVHSGENIVAKTIHYAVNVTLTEAELFVIKYGINQMIQVNYTSCIIIVTDAIHLIYYFILIKSSPLLQLKILDLSLRRVSIIPLNSGIVLATPNGFIIQLSIKKQRSLTSIQSSYANCHGTTA